MLPVPPCTEEKGYFYRPVSLTKVEDVENRAKQALRKKQAHFVFHWRGGGLNRAVLEDILTRCQALAQAKGRGVACFINRAQSVIQLDFPEGPGTGIDVQQPDEGWE